MKKIILCLMLITSLFTTAFSAEIYFRTGNDTISLNGQSLKVKKPYVDDGTTLVPLRVILEAFGAEVTWNEADMSIDLTLNDIKIKIKIGSTSAIVNGAEQKMQKAPVLDGDSTMVPLRFISENFGADVSYDDNTGEIKVTLQQAEKGAYANKTANYKLNLSDGWEVNDRVPSNIKFSKGKARFSIYVFNSLFDSIDKNTLLEEFVQFVKSTNVMTGFNKIETTRIVGSNLASVVSCKYNINETSYSDLMLCFETSGFTYQIIAHFEGDTADQDYTDFYAMLDGSSFMPISQRQEDIYERGHKQMLTDDKIGIKIELPYSWEIDSSGEGFVAYDEEYKIDITSKKIVYSAIADTTMDNQELYNYYEDIFYKNKGTSVKHTEIYREQLVGGHKYKTLAGSVDEYNRPVRRDGFIGKSYLPSDIPDFYKDSMVYAFCTHAEEGEESKLIFVFRKGKTMMTAVCRYNEIYSQEYNKKFYGEIIKSILKNE